MKVQGQRWDHTPATATSNAASGTSATAPSFLDALGVTRATESADAPPRADQQQHNADSEGDRAAAYWLPGNGAVSTADSVGAAPAPIARPNPGSLPPPIVAQPAVPSPALLPSQVGAPMGDAALVRTDLLPTPLPASSMSDLALPVEPPASNAAVAIAPDLHVELPAPSIDPRQSPLPATPAKPDPAQLRPAPPPQPPVVEHAITANPLVQNPGHRVSAADLPIASTVTVAGPGELASASHGPDHNALLYPQLLLPHGRLSQLQSSAALPQALERGAQAVTQGSTARSTLAPAAPEPLAFSALPRANVVNAALQSYLRQSANSQADGDGLETRSAMLERAVAASMPWLAKLIRVSFDAEGTAEIWVRDYSLNEQEQGRLVDSITQQANAGQLNLRRVVVNGHTVWQQARGDR